jgi:hypothetical protein
MRNLDACEGDGREMETEPAVAHQRRESSQNAEVQEAFQSSYRHSGKPQEESG